jgi:hypothetical protein
VKVRRHLQAATDRGDGDRRLLPAHPAERLSTCARYVLIFISVVAGIEMLMAFRTLQSGPAGNTLPMLERMAQLWSRNDADRLREQLVAEPGAVAAFQRALIVDLLFPAAYCGLGVLIGSGTARAVRLHGGRWAKLGRASAWLLTLTFLFDHGENAFLWREIDGGVFRWEPPVTWTLHGLKWATGVAGGLFAAGSTIGLVGHRQPDLNSE